MNCATKDERDKRRKTQLSLNHGQHQLRTLKLEQNTSRLLMTSNNLYKDNHAFYYQLNIQAAPMAFYLGTDGYDIGAMACFLGIPCGRAWELTFHRHSTKIHATVMSVTKYILVEAFEDEVIAKMEEKLKDKYTSEGIDEFVTKYFFLKMTSYLRRYKK